MNYHHLVLTTHAQDRLQQRAISLDAVEAAVVHPDKKYPGKQAGTTKFIKTINGRRLHIIAQHLPDKDQWLIISVWVRGEDDRPSLAWQILALPFKILWWMISKLLQKIGL
jgi:hypothetical protein